jgi:DNA invertase Pin-like site-specific DNA recombinase
MAIIGYARVSSYGQDLTVQHEALSAAGCTRIFAEKISGARSDRPQLVRLLRTVEPGDMVVVTRLDRLARSTLDLLRTVDEIAKVGAVFRSLADTWADTTTPHGKLMLVVLAGLAEFERSLIRSRVEAGIRKAREKGVQFGRPPALNPKQRRMIAARRAKGAAIAVLSREFKVGQATVHRILQSIGWTTKRQGWNSRQFH